MKWLVMYCVYIVIVVLMSSMNRLKESYDTVVVVLRMKYWFLPVH